MMNILVVHPFKEVIGPHQVLYRLVRGVHGERYRFSVMLPGDGTAARQFESLGADVSFIPELSSFTRTRNPFHLVRQVGSLVLAVAKVRRFIRQHDIDLVHSTTVQSWVGGIAARLAGVPSVYHMHDLAQSWPVPVAWLTAWFLELTGSEVICVSEAALRGLPLPARGGCKPRVVYNGVDTLEYRPCGLRAEIRRELGVEFLRPIIATIGAIEQRKGHEWLVRACVHVRSVYPHVLILFIGGVPENCRRFHEYLVGLVDESSLTENILFLGQRNDVPRLLGAVDLLVQPSLSESFGLAVAEAMSCAVPVIATAVGGLAELIKDGETGLLVPPADSKALADAIIILLDNSHRREIMGQAGRRRIEERFELKRQCNKITSIYDDLVGQSVSRN